MEKLIAKIGYADRNYSALVELPDEVVVVTHSTLEGVKNAVIESLEFSKEGHLESGKNVPAWVNGYEVEYELEVSALLQYLDGILTRSALSRVTGINERQLGHYATGHRKPRAKQREKIINGIRRIGEEFLSVV
jgi:hypothetical protein